MSESGITLRNDNLKPLSDLGGISIDVMKSPIPAKEEVRSSYSRLAELTGEYLLAGMGDTLTFNGDAHKVRDGF